MKEILKKEVKEIIKDKKILSALNHMGIHSVEELCGYSRMELNENGFENTSVKDIRIALQLNGVDLKPNHAKRNNLIMR